MRAGASVLRDIGPVATMPAAARASLANQVHATLRGQILHARLRPGDPVSENELAERLQVSRTPVREAVQRLVAEGLIYVVPQRGSFIARLRIQAIREALFVREAVECQIALRLMASPELAEVLEELESHIARQAVAVQAEDVAATMAADAQFHQTMIDRSGLPGVWAVVSQVRDLHQRVRAIAVPELRAGADALRDHRAIVGALRSGQADAVLGAVREHLGRNVVLTEQVARMHPHYFEPEPE